MSSRRWWTRSVVATTTPLGRPALALHEPQEHVPDSLDPTRPQSWWPSVRLPDDFQDLAGVLGRNPHDAGYVASRLSETWHKASFDRLEPKHHDDRDGECCALCGRGLRVADGE